MNRKLTLALTAGDPCGIGPEIILKTLTSRPFLDAGGRVRLVVIGDAAVFERTATRLRLRLPPWTVMPASSSQAGLPARCVLLDLGHAGRFVPGASSARAGAASLEYLDVAIRLCRQGLADGMVTAPVTKWAIQRTRRGFEGQTEYLARAFRARSVVMMFVSDRLRVALLSRHVALRDVPRLVTPTLVCQTVRVVSRTLRNQFGVRRPRLAMCGLNPHAGERGRFGTEERRVLGPALRRLRREGIRLEGPFAADGLFVDAARYDAVLCWYHDQGLIPFKLMARDAGCQLSAGLPVIRSSPDHGSALDIAGKGVADCGSMRYALELALRLVLAKTRV